MDRQWNDATFPKRVPFWAQAPLIIWLLSLFVLATFAQSVEKENPAAAPAAIPAATVAEVPAAPKAPWTSKVYPSHSLPDRVAFWSQVQDLHLGYFLEAPVIELRKVFLNIDDIPKELQKENEWKALTAIHKLATDGAPEKAYPQADELVKKLKNQPLGEWVSFLKADYLLMAQDKHGENGKFALALDEYLDVARRFPLNPQLPRVLYQTGLTQLKMSFYPDVQATVNRALKEYPNSDFVGLLHLLLGEQAFLTNDDVQANFEFSFLIERFPKSRAAVDAAYRKAFMLFRRGRVADAYKTYQNLERYHSEEIEALKLKTSPENSDRFKDRVFYAETVFLSGRYEEASELFQSLSNLFPNHALAPYLFIRFGDTFWKRGQEHSAEELYRVVIKRYSKDEVATAYAHIHLSDLLFVTGSVQANIKNMDAYEDAFVKARKQKNDEVAALALARLAAHHLYFKTYPKAQAVLKQYKDIFEKTLNQKWAEDQYANTVQLEILDYHAHGDYMAALATFLVYENHTAGGIANTAVLTSLADAAKKLSLFEKATQLLNRVVYLEKTSEGRQSALLKLVDLLIIQGEYRKASERLRRYNFAYPNTKLRYLYDTYWGDLYTGLKNSEQAVFHYERAIKAAETQPQQQYDIRRVYLAVATHYENLKLPIRAIEAYENYNSLLNNLQKNPLASMALDDKDVFHQKIARYRIADIYFDMQDYTRALDAYRIVATNWKEEPFVSQARFRQGECLLALNDRQAAVSIFKTIDSKDSKNIWAHAAKSYIQTVEMEVKYGIRILN